MQNKWEQSNIITQWTVCKINPYDEPNTQIEQSTNLNSTFIASLGNLFWICPRLGMEKSTKAKSVNASSLVLCTSACIEGVFVGNLMLLF